MTIRRFPFAAVAAGLLLAMLPHGAAQAIDYYWDTNGATLGFGTAGGTWGTSNFFSTSASGTAATTLETTTQSDGIAFGTNAAGFGLASGTVTVSGSQNIGNVSFGADSGAVTLSGGTLWIGASTFSAGPATSTLLTRVRGTGSLTKTGTGVLALNGNNDYSGGTIVSQGTLQIGTGLVSGSFTGAMNVNPGATLRIFRGGTLSLANVALTGDGGLELVGTGTVNQSSYTLTGTHGAFAGPVTVDKARANMGSRPTALGSGTITILPGGQIYTGTGPNVFTNPVVVSGTGWGQGGTGASFGAIRLDNGATWAGPITLAGDSVISAWATTGTFSGKISGPRVLTIGAVSGGQPTLSNAANDWTGGTIVASGGVTLGSPTALSTGLVTVSSTYGKSVAFSFGNGTTGTVANAFVLPAVTAQTQVFPILGAPTSPTTVRLTGTLSGGSPTSDFRLADSDVTGNHNNVLILDNPGNTFQGTLTAFRGWLGFTSDGALGNADNDLVVNVNANNGGLRFEAGGITLAASRSVLLAAAEVIDTQAFAGRIDGVISGSTPTSQLTKRGTGSLTLAGANTYGGGTVVESGTLVAASSTAFGTGTTTFGGSATVDLGGQAVSSALANTGGTLANAGSFAGTQTVSGPSTFSGSVGGTTNVVTGGIVGGSAVTFTGPVTFLAGGTQAPGTAAPGSQSFAGGLTYQAGSTLAWDLAANTAAPADRGTAYDAIDVTAGSLTVSSSSALNLVFNAAGSTVNWSDSFWSSDRSWKVVDFTSPSPGTMSGVFTLGSVGVDSVGQSLQSVSGRESASFSVGTVGNAIVLTYSAVPEPSTIALVTGAAIALIMHRPRRDGGSADENSSSE
jgi:autotransporter-associated beta strand protein